MAAKKAPSLLVELRRQLAREGDPARAKGAQAYMKTMMPFWGVPMPKLRASCKRAIDADPPADAASLRRDVLAIWSAATHREEKYAAIELADHRRSRPFVDLDALPLFERMIVEGAWWDLVDPIATHLLPRILERDPKPMRAAMLAWARSDDLWKRRAAIICQVTRKEKTDLPLLYACIEPSLDRKEFWLRKAIGWALRSYAWTDPDEVARWVAKNRDRLSGLSLREATKNLGATSSPARAAPRRSASAGRRTPSRARRASS